LNGRRAGVGSGHIFKKVLSKIIVRCGGGLPGWRLRNTMKIPSDRMQQGHGRKPWQNALLGPAG